MKVQLDKPILNFEGEPIQNGDEVITYGKIFRQLLGAPTEKDKGKGDQKLKKFEIGMKCVADEADLSLDERKLIKDLADEMGLNPIIYGRICKVLEGQENREGS